MFWKPVIVGLGGVLGAQAADVEGRKIGEVLAGAPSMSYRPIPPSLQPDSMDMYVRLRVLLTMYSQ